MATYTIRAAKTHLAKLVGRAEAGEEIVLARGKEPVARIVPMTPKAKPKRKFGAFKGRIKIGPEFFEPLPEDELKRWE
jgi:antitoxin (DNA-binding transcriptional repressor) of toxin-antitoxin stability system